jgi:formamidopyrimidine-DNA glycosylase
VPELPEVETIRLGLQRYVVGHTIVDVEVRLAKMLSGDVKYVIGAKIIGVRRFGKGLVIDLDNGFSIAVHVKMTGQLLYVFALDARGSASAGASADKPVAPGFSFDLPDKYTHVIFSLDNNADLYYRDIRQFGWVKILATKDVLELPFFKSLGLEPLKNLTFEKFKERLTVKTAIKLVLMDQKKIAGIGNIYANDALFMAKIHPKRPASSLSKNEQKELFIAIEKVLQKGIEAGGASEWNYVDVLGGRGKYQNFFQVYQKEGKPCRNCGTIIEKITLGSRGTFFCPACQR